MIFVLQEMSLPILKNLMIFLRKKYLLKENGIFVVEVPHLLNIYTDLQFDNVFHEHVGFHSLKSINDLCLNNGMYLYELRKE